MRAKICKEPGCSTLINGDSTYCEKHIRSKRVPFQNAVRSNESLYNTTKWRKLRKQILKDIPYCVRCGTTINLELHHKIPPRGDEDSFFDEDNLIPVCKRCHRLETAREILNRR